jgi:hypothetical protein
MHASIISVPACPAWTNICNLRVHTQYIEKGMISIKHTTIQMTHTHPYAIPFDYDKYIYNVIFPYDVRLFIISARDTGMILSSHV